MCSASPDSIRSLRSRDATNFSRRALYLMEEEELDRIAVDRCLQGDVDAFGVLIERYQRPVFNTVLHMVGDAEDAREVCQQAFMKAFEHLASYDRERKFFSWIYRVAVNESINHLKARKPHETLDERLQHPRANPAERFEELEEWTHLHEAIMNLEPNYRAVVILRHFVHFSYNEIAEILNLPEKTVKSRLFTARQQLREALEAKGHGHQ
ncbi:MAG: RNA polymerase [Acidobacteria bacterium]|nr:MAG: RNA polymerase [Acidobacteriota bacterium]